MRMLKKDRRGTKLVDNMTIPKQLLQTVNGSETDERFFTQIGRFGRQKKSLESRLGH